MKNKFLISIIVFFGFFFFSCFNVNASEWLELSSNFCSTSIVVERDTHPDRITLSYNESTSSVTGISKFHVDCSFNSNNLLSANHEYRFAFVLGNGTSAFFPYLSSVGRNYVLDTNMLFTSKDFSFISTDNVTLTRDNLIDSVFSMGYEDQNTTEPIYYINFSLVSPYDLTSFTIDLFPNNNLLNTNSQYIWLPSTNGNFTNLLSVSHIYFDYGTFQGYENPNICIGDQCSYAPYLGYSNQIQSDIQSGGFNLRTFISDSFDRIGSFVSASFYLFSICSALFTALPIEIRSLLIFTFSLGCVIILWKVLRS